MKIILKIIKKKIIAILDNYLISESVLPQILPNSKNTKDYYQSIINYSQNDIYNTQHDINEINQLMNNIINDINGNKGF